MEQEASNIERDDNPASKPWLGLKFKILAIVAILFVTCAVIASIWAFAFSQNQGFRHAEDQAIALCDQMDAAWAYVKLHQPATNIYVRKLGKDAEGLVCVNAVKSIARDFNETSEGKMGIVSLQPRNDEDLPDEFERKALEAFRADSTLDSYSGVATNEDGMQTYYYLRPKRILQTCLTCHGEPAGEPDPLGYKREGYKVGDVVGAFSVQEPLEAKNAEARDNVLQGVFLFLASLLVVMAIIYTAVGSIVVKPLERIASEASEYRPGKGMRIRAHDANDEIGLLVRDLNGMESELDDLYTNLEIRVEERTAELHRLNKELEAERVTLANTLDQLSKETECKAQHFSALSHDLRVPLMSIIAYAQTARTAGALQNRPDTSIDGGIDEAHMLDQIIDQAQTMSTMVDNMLSFTRADIQGIEAHPVPIDLVDLAMGLQSQMEPIAKRCGLEFSVEFDETAPLIQADSDLLIRVADNLIGNAFKFTPAGGHIHAQLETRACDGVAARTLVLRVEDDGIGVKPEDEPLIFLPYKRGETEAPNKHGIGLGLAVVRQIADALDGDITYERREQGGSRFIFTCPVVPINEGEYL